MRFVVFQHGASEHPGIFRRFFKEDGIHCDVVELDQGEPIPVLDPYDAMLVMVAGWNRGTIGTTPGLQPSGTRLRSG
jgi:hypothetical protein